MMNRQIYLQPKTTPWEFTQNACRGGDVFFFFLGGGGVS